MMNNRRRTAWFRRSQSEITFVSTWQTSNTSTGSSASNQIKLPLVSGGVYDFIVEDWGDGASDHITAWNQTEVTHTYASAGIKVIKIKGIINRFSFANSGDRLKILDINKWGPLVISSNTNANAGVFMNCANLVISADDVPDLSIVHHLTSAFYGTTNLYITNIANWDFHLVQSGNSMFRLSGFNNAMGSKDFSALTNANSMFRQASYNHPIAWVGSGTLLCTEMFYQSSFNSSINITGQLRGASSMFRSCPFNQPISHLDFTGNTTTQLMFNANSAFDQDIGGINMESVTVATNMFIGVGLSNTNYDALLNGWASQSLKSGVSFHGGTSKYSPAAAAARAYIISTFGWTITDGGPV